MYRILGALGVVVLFAAFLAWAFYPDIPGSAAGWVVLIVLGVPAYMFLEWLGDFALGSQFFKNSSSFTRIVLGVPAALVLISIALFVVWFVQQSINVVGG